MTGSWDRRRLLVGAAAVTTATAAIAAEPRREAPRLGPGDLAKLIPLRVGERLGLDDASVVPERVDTSPTSGQTVTRRYVGDAGSPVMLVVSYHGSRSPELKVHRPETCYTVAGFRVDPPRRTTIALEHGQLIPAMTFSSHRGSRNETVLYWTRVGSAFPQTLAGQRLAFIRQALEGFRADGLLMRLSVVEDGERTELTDLRAFARQLLSLMGADARGLLFGPLARADA